MLVGYLWHEWSKVWVKEGNAEPKLNWVGIVALFVKGGANLKVALNATITLREEVGKAIEEHLPKLLDDIKVIVAAESQTEPSFEFQDNPLIYPLEYGRS